MLAFNRLRIDPGDGYPVIDYRIEDGCVESRVVEMSSEESLETENVWNRLTPEELSSHVMADTVVARWLSHRMGVFPLVRACHQDFSAASHSQEQRSQRVAA